MLLFPDRVLNPYEYICQSTHNNLRQIHSVKTMSWNNFFVSLADSKVILLLQNNTGPSALENFSKQFLKEGIGSASMMLLRQQRYLNFFR